MLTNFHRHKFDCTILIFITLVGAILRFWKWKELPFGKFHTMCTVIFVLPIILGMLYSIMVKPVIQFSMLLFSFPFFLLFVFSWTEIKNKYVTISLILAIMSLNILSLFNERKHYDLMLNQPFNSIVSQTFKALNHIGKNKSTSIYIGGNSQMIYYYQNKYGHSFPFISTHENGFTKKKYYETLKNDTSDYIICSLVDQEFVNMIREKYNCIEKYKEGITYEWYLFSKNSCNDMNETTLFSTNVNYTSNENNWSYDTLNVVKNDSVYFQQTLESEYGPTIDLLLSDVIENRFAKVDIVSEFMSIDDAGKIIVDIYKDNKSSSYIQFDVNEYRDSLSHLQWTKAYFTLRLTGEFENSDQIQKSRIRIYHWNSNRTNIKLKNINVHIRNSNPIVYGLIEEL